MRSIRYEVMNRPSLVGRIRSSVEPLCGKRQVIGRNARPEITHGNGVHIALRNPFDLYRRAPRILKGVTDKIAHDLPEPRLIRLDESAVKAHP